MKSSRTPFPAGAARAVLAALLAAVSLAGRLEAADPVAAGSAAPAPPSAAPSATAVEPGSAVGAHQMTQEEKMGVKELTRIPNEVGSKLPYEMRLDDEKYVEMFPLAISKENPTWFLSGPDRFLVFKWWKDEPFRDRRGRFIKPPGSSAWAYLVAEDDTFYYFQWMPPGMAKSPEHFMQKRTEHLRDQRQAAAKSAKIDASLPSMDEEEKKKYLRSYLGVPGHAIAREPASVEPPRVDVLEFRSSSTGLPDTGLWQFGSALADVNGDGKLDIVAPPARKALGASPNIWLGDGKGGWRHWDEAKFPSDFDYDYGDVGVGDFDGDGHADVVLAMHNKGGVVCYGDGKGDFTRYYRFFQSSDDFNARALAVADFDGDKRPDVAFEAEIDRDPRSEGKQLGAPLLRIFLSRGPGKWESRNEGVTPWLFGDQLAVGDFDHDKRPDLVASSHQYGHTGLVHLNRGPKGWEIWKPKLLGNSYIWGVAAGDLNGDGWDDLVLGFQYFDTPKTDFANTVTQGSTAEAEKKSKKIRRGGIVVFYNDHKGGMSDPVILAMDDRSTYYPFIRVGDIDGDGRKDIITCSSEGKMRLLLQRSKGKFFQEESPELESGTPAVGAQIRDIDGDGRPDLIINYSSEDKGGMIRCFLGGSGAGAPASGKDRKDKKEKK